MRPLLPSTAGLVAVLGLLVASCSSDGREMRPPSPDQTNSIITTTTTTPPTGFEGLDTQPPTLPATDVVDGDATDDTGDDTLATLPADGFTVALPWPDGGRIDPRFTCDGEDVSPTLRWIGLPEGTVEVAVAVVDTDAEDFIHWVVAGLDPALETLTEGELPVGAIEGTNGFDDGSLTSIGWAGPCPPDGATHIYRVEVYALDQQIELPTGTPGPELLRAISFATIAMTASEAVYGRG